MKDSLRFQGNVWKTHIVETVEKPLSYRTSSNFLCPLFQRIRMVTEAE